MMNNVLRAALAFLPLCVSCASERHESSRRKRELIRWRLTERSYGSIEEPWATGGDGIIPSGELALVHEPVYRDETLAGGLVVARTTCAHKLRLEYGGPPTLEIGKSVEVGLRIDGPEDLSHEVRIEGSHPRVVITGVSGAKALADKPGHYVLASKARASITFTSAIAGRGGLILTILAEVPNGKERRGHSEPH